MAPSWGLRGAALVPVRSLAAQALLPSVIPMRLWPWEATGPLTSTPVAVPPVMVIPATMLPRKLIVLPLSLGMYSPPPSAAVLALTVLFTSETGAGLYIAPPTFIAVLPVNVLLVNDIVPLTEPVSMS